jgi:predicted DNA-binding protein
MEAPVVTVWVAADEYIRLQHMARGTGTSLGHIVRMFLAQNPLVQVNACSNRPSENRPISIRLSVETVEWLDNLARLRGESRSDILRSIFKSIETVEPLVIKVANTNSKKEHYNVA